MRALVTALLARPNRSDSAPPACLCAAPMSVQRPTGMLLSHPKCCSVPTIRWRIATSSGPAYDRLMCSLTTEVAARSAAVMSGLMRSDMP
jgi:hypothetical protein